MAIKNFISSVWSETLLNSLEKEYVAVRNCYREFEGDLQNNEIVQICAIKGVNIFEHSRNSTIQAPELLTDESVFIGCSQARGFNFLVDDIDRAQSKPSIMQSAMRQAANGLANEADKYVFSLHEDISDEQIISNHAVTADNILDTIIAVREKMLTNNVNSNIETVLEVSPQIASILLKAKITQLTNNEDAMYNGYIGSLVGFDIYVSNNIGIGENGEHLCFARTKRAIAFAEQINSIEAYRPENYFADAVKGLYFFGANIIYPEELVLVSLKPATV